MNDLNQRKRPIPSRAVRDPSQSRQRPTNRQRFLARYSRPLLFIGIYWIFAIVFRLQNSAAYFFDGLLLTLALTTASAVFAHVVSNTVKSRRWRFITGMLFLLLPMVLYLSQMVYYTIFKQFYSVYSAGNAGQVLEFWQDILWGIFQCLPFFLLYFGLFFFFVFYTMRLEPRLPRMKKHYRWEKLFAVIALQLFITCLLIPCAMDASSAYARFFGQEDLYTSYHTVGALKSFELDFMRLILPQSAGSEALDKIPSQLPDAPKDTESDPLKTTDDETAEQPTQGMTQEKPVVYGDNVMEIDFAALANGESNAALKQLHTYFSQVAPSKKNAYTGLYEGYNLIWITAESFHTVALHPEITPTLYKMAHGGYYFENFYNASWPTSTTDGEYAVCTSLIPKSGVWSFKESGGGDDGKDPNLMYFCLGNQLGRLGYKTTAYHNHNYDYYRRDLSHPNMGYTFWGRDKSDKYPYNMKDKLVEWWLWPESDHEMLQGTIADYISDQPFHTYYMTVSGHMKYDYVGNSMAVRHRDKVSHLNLSEAAQAYLACNIELDLAMEHLLNELRAAGIADKTLIVISGDHYPYGLDGTDGSHAAIEELLGHPLANEYEVMHSALVMYVDGMEPVTVTKPCSSLDVLPTISNLLGVEYDSRLLMGTDIFSDSPGLVIFQDRSFITDAGLYMYKKKTFVANEGYSEDKEYISSVTGLISGRIEASRKILDLDYYRVLFGKN